MTAPFDYLIVVFLVNPFYQNYLEPSFSISTEFGAESGITLPDKPNIKKLEDIIPSKGRTKYFFNIKLTAQNYVCNMTACKAEDADDTWFIANNLEQSLAIREYKKRFDIEEMFKDFKAGGFNLEDTWTEDRKSVV